MYREAKDKNKQIRILQDLNMATRDEIIKILEEEGAMVKKEKPQTSDDGTAAGKGKNQKTKGRKQDASAKNHIKSPRKTESENADKEFLEKVMEFYQETEERIRSMKDEIVALEKIAAGCADMIEGLMVVTEAGKEKSDV